VSSRTIIEKFHFPVREDTNRGARRIKYETSSLCGLPGNRKMNTFYRYLEAPK